MSLGGGFHYAKPYAGGRFSVYSDIGIAAASLRARNLIGETDRIAHIDTDAYKARECAIDSETTRASSFSTYTNR